MGRKAGGAPHTQPSVAAPYEHHFYPRPSPPAILTATKKQPMFSFLRVLPIAALTITLTLAAIPASASDLVLKRVMLSAGGVGYLEYEAEVSGDAELALDVPLAQVDDVLKSIVVYDSKGGVGSAQLAGRDPLSQIYNELPFGAEALASPAALLNALQGAEIKVGASRPISGRLLKVVPETVQLGERGSTTRNRVSVLTGTGLQQFILEDADSVSFVDPALQAQVDKALSELAAHRAKDRRRIALNTLGTGTRVVRIGYVVGASLWKANYRLTLPQDAASAKAHLQGWAVLENMSGQDWKDVELTLLSGNPVSFRQAIYQAYYVNRPEVPVEVLGRVLPKPDTGVVAQPRVQGLFKSANEPRALSAPAPAPAPGAQPFKFGGATSFDDEAEGPDLPLKSRAANTAVSEEGATQVAFRIPVPISIGSGQSALVPIVEAELPIERFALFQSGTSGARPFASLRLRNDTPTALPPGVLTLYEQTAAGIAYVGDARLSPLPAGEDRLVSYAVDEKTKVVPERALSRVISKGSIAQGVLALTRTQRQTTTYRIAAPTAEPRRLIIEHPKADGWKLVDPEGAELTASAYRFTLDLKPGESRTVTIVFESPMTETLRIADMPEQVIAEVTDSGGVDPAIKRAFADLAQLRRLLADKQAAAAQVQDKLAALKSDQARIRDNIAKIGPDSALYKRYLEKLTAQETEFETLHAAADKAAAETKAASTAVDGFIAGLQI
jgi:hypothetical protein